MAGSLNALGIAHHFQRVMEQRVFLFLWGEFLVFITEHDQDIILVVCAFVLPY